MPDSSALIFEYFFTAGSAVGAGLALTIAPAAFVYTWCKNRFLEGGRKHGSGRNSQR